MAFAVAAQQERKGRAATAAACIRGGAAQSINK